ncbi:MAG: undecaprenyl-diphosphate phosphatase [Armatimonadetes bacterium]|nr:undecaprenyl-diphosphate phosphatase [Armatimonadota bacterium]
MLSPLQAIILGIVQGLTEFLPVSSTAHLILFPWLLGWRDPGQTFDVSLHVGTLLAVAIYFWSDWVEMFTRRHDQLKLVVVGCIPAAAAGVLLEKKIEYLSLPGEFPYAPLLIAFFLALVGLWLYWVDQHGKKQREMDGMRIQDALLIGLGQAFALLPGVSRSGATIGTGLLLGMTRESAARFSFLLSTPIIAGAVAYKGLKLFKAGVTPEQSTAMLWGILASGISGYIAIAFLMRLVRTRSYTGFVVYRIVLAVGIVAIWILRR